jgi:hypothetical protein
MRGHVRQRGTNSWAIVLDVRDPVTGERRRRWHSFRGSKREAQSECAKLIAKLKSGTYLEPNKTTIAQFLEHWLAHKRLQISPRTHECYAEVAQNILPGIGNSCCRGCSPPSSPRCTCAPWNGYRPGACI